MEKVKETIRKVEIHEHSFYCDECGEHIGTSEEYDDGWYETYGNFELKFYVDGWYYIKKCLCETCRKNFINNVKAYLTDMGFKR